MHSRNVHVPELEHGIGAFLSAAEPNVFRLTKGTLQKRISDSKESSSSNSSNSQNQTEHETIKVLSLNDAFQTVTSQTVVVLVIVMSYLSVMCLGLCMPLFAAVPGGFFDEDGLFKFISIGFKQHTVLASIVYGLAMPCISFMRFLAIIVYVTSPFRALLYTILQMICMGAGIVTVRYDVVVEMHFVAAAIWIASSLVFYMLVGAFNKNYSSVNGGVGLKIAWTCSFICAMMFLAFIIVFNSAGRDPNHFLIAGINEYLTAFFILVMDFMMTHSIHTRYLNGADIFSEMFRSNGNDEGKNEKGMVV